MPFAETRMNLEMTILSTVSQTDKYHTISIICRIKKKHHQKTETNLWLPKGKVGWGKDKLGSCN